MDPKALLSAISEHKWLVVATICIGFFIRLLRDDNSFPITLPPVISVFGRSVESKRIKPWIAVALGLAYGVLEKVGAGATWRRAITDAAIAGLLPIVGHELGIESVRDGKELSLPDSSGGPAGPTVLHSFALPALVAIASLLGIGCSALKGPNTVIAVDVAEKIACAIANAEKPNSIVQSICKIADAEMPVINQELSAARTKIAAVRADFAGCGPAPYRAPIAPAPMPSSSACANCGAPVLP